MTNTYILSNENIDIISETVDKFLSKNKLKKQNIINIKISVGNILLKYLNTFGSGGKVDFICEKRLEYSKIVMRIYGKSINPFEDIGEDDLILNSALSKIGIAPVWRYQSGFNVITFTLPVKRETLDFINFILALVLGIGLGLIARGLPKETYTSICADWIDPISSTIMGLLGTLSSIMIFLVISNGICGMGNISTFKKIGTKLTTNFLSVNAVFALIAISICLLFYSIGENTVSILDVTRFVKTVLGIIPTNVFDAFLSGNAMQIIFLSIFMSIVLLIISSATKELIDWLAQAELVIEKMVMFVIRFIPIVVFTKIFELTANSSIKEFLSLYRYIVILLCIAVLSMLSYLLFISIKYKVPVKILVKKFTPSFMIAISAASSSAIMSTDIAISENKLGIDKSIAKVGIPLGVVVFCPTGVCSYIIASVCLMQIYQIPLSVSSLITIFISSYILSIAEPPIAGGAISCFILLFSQLGIPPEAISLIIPLLPFTDRIVTSSKNMNLKCELINIAGSLDMLDKNILLKDN